MRFRDSLTGYEKYDEELWLSDDVPEIEIEVAYKVKRLLHYEQSLYSEISIIENKGFGRLLVIDGTPQYSTNDGFIYNEMLAHIPMTAHPTPKKVAIIGGGSCGPAREVLKYPEVEKVNIVEIDQRVTEVCRTWFPLETSALLDNRTEVSYRDGTEWIKEQKNLFDVMIIDRSDPYGPATVLYKPQFYKDTFHALSEDGIVVFQSGSPFYYSHLLSDTIQNLRKLYPIVRTYLASVPVFPGGIWSFTIASKKHDPLSSDLRRLQCQETKYVNPEIYTASFILPNYVKQAIK